MRKTLTLLVASTALTAAIGLPAWSAMHTPASGSSKLFAAIFEDGAQALPVILASDDDDRGDRETSRRGHDNDDKYRGRSERDDCDDDDDDDNCRAGARNPAPAGAVTPPQNGLFGKGAPPQVQVK